MSAFRRRKKRKNSKRNPNNHFFASIHSFRLGRVIVRCKKCGKELTKPLRPVADAFVAYFPDGANTVPQGYYWVADDSNADAIIGHVLIHLDDRINMKDRPDYRRHNGCCGEDGCDGPSQICKCGNEVATVVSDCRTSYYVYFEFGHTILDSL